LASFLLPIFEIPYKTRKGMTDQRLRRVLQKALKPWNKEQRGDEAWKLKIRMELGCVRGLKTVLICITLSYKQLQTELQISWAASGRLSL